MKVRYIWRFFWLVAFVIISQSAVAQTAQVTKPVTTFKQKISESNAELRWSQVYFSSYNKTTEIEYLKLSGNHCLQAIKILAEAQQTTPNTSTYYYRIKKLRFDACEYYDTLIAVSRQLSADDYISEVPNLCD